MKVKDIATMQIETVQPTDTVGDVARKMQMANVGFMPVVRDGSPIGIITDRDIAIRCVAENKDTQSLRAQDIMTCRVHWVHDEENAEDAAWVMANCGVRRLLVTNRRGVAVGVVSLDDLALFTNGDQTTGRILSMVGQRRKPLAQFAS